MSKRNTRNSGFLLRIVAIVVAFGSCLSLLSDLSVAQDKGFSIFEQAETSSDAPVVAPKEAFTNPVAALPKSQFGSFENVATTVSSKPQLRGSKPEGTYAHDGPSMFRQPPAAQEPPASRKLQPFTTNSLRSGEVKANNEIKLQGKPAPIVVEDFQKSARPLSPVVTNPTQTQPLKPKVAQVAFQDGGFTPTNRPQGQSSASRFSQSAPSSASSVPSAASRFSNSAPKSSPAFSSQPIQRRTTFGQSETQSTPSRQPIQSFTPAVQQRNTPPVRNEFSNSRAQQNPLTPQPRVAALPQQSQPVTRRANQMNPQPGKKGSQAAKELLGKWSQIDPKLNLPGKQMKLHEFLAQPINGSRKDAINQYWVTFGDMANHKLAIEQAKWLSSITNLRQQSDQAVLKAAQQAAQNRVLHTEIQLAKSQSILGDFLPNLRYKNGKNIPVLPTDVPWVGKLNTKLAEYQARGIVPGRFNAIDEILPKARQLIANRADAVNAATGAAQQAKRALANGAPIANVLEAVRMKARNQQDFLSNVTGYNRAITDYVLSVRQDINQPKRLASVLIGRKSIKSSLAKTETPEEDVDALLNGSGTRMRQISTGKSVLSKGSNSLVGKSAYQNQSDESEEEDSSNSLSSMKTAQAATPTKKSFEYGPTKESAAAAKFDPAKVKAELPMQQAKSKGTSPVYPGNTANNAAGNRISRSPQNTNNQGSFDRLKRNGPTDAGRRGGFSPQSPVVQKQNSSAQSRFNPSAPTGGFNPTTSTAGPQRTTFPPTAGGEAEKTPSIPAAPTSDPFKNMRSQADSTEGASLAPRVERSFGGGAGGGSLLGSGAPKSDSTASRFQSGSSGFGSSRR